MAGVFRLIPRRMSILRKRNESSNECLGRLVELELEVRKYAIGVVVFIDIRFDCQLEDLGRIGL